ncbi:hypothetical protein L7F22_016987 [Adiantum nelumboides]|nr:hypothetical protein [Adiantum nelumboides]
MLSSHVLDLLPRIGRSVLQETYVNRGGWVMGFKLARRRWVRLSRDVDLRPACAVATDVRLHVQGVGELEGLQLSFGTISSVITCRLKFPSGTWFWMEIPKRANAGLAWMRRFEKGGNVLILILKAPLLILQRACQCLHQTEAFRQHGGNKNGLDQDILEFA